MNKYSNIKVITMDQIAPMHLTMHAGRYLEHLLPGHDGVASLLSVSRLANDITGHA